ncbi:hypothetical protein [Herbaspirillum sp. NPDC101397]|uniref:hypothetical protein n=1 Tax=Herbaspirillum sp. NPDC101397 TaxID=3364006 RepID=UPI00383A5302
MSDIIVFDGSVEIRAALEQNGLSTTHATLGSVVRVPNRKTGDKQVLVPDEQWPANFHEYKVAILDLTSPRVTTQTGSLPPNTKVAFRSTYPETSLDLRPFGAARLRDGIDDFIDRQSVTIIFFSRPVRVTYQIGTVGEWGLGEVEDFGANLTTFYAGCPSYSEKSGTKMKGAGADPIATLLSRYLSGSYGTIFEHPTQYVDGGWVNAQYFSPLAVNADGEIIAFINFKEAGTVIGLPNIDDKAGFCHQLINEVIPDLIPSLFPELSSAKWTDSADYQLPGVQTLLDQRAAEVAAHELSLATLDVRLAETRAASKFLHDLLTETGDALVEAVHRYCEWLEFPSVKMMDDDSNELLEEDLQIEVPSGLLIVEVKGLHGTSTDSECSQIAKIRFRRNQQRGKVDVDALYIVNHQRHLAPLSRTNPPFNDRQQEDARLDSRGLLTTYSLFEAYFLIERGLLTKADVRQAFRRHGYIDPTVSGLELLGTPLNVFAEHKAVIINIPASVTIKVGDTVVVQKAGTFTETSVVSIQVKDVDVTTHTGGKLGIALAELVPKSCTLYLKP